MKKQQAMKVTNDKNARRYVIRGGNGRVHTGDIGKRKEDIQEAEGTSVLIRRRINEKEAIEKTIHYLHRCKYFEKLENNGF